MDGEKRERERQRDRETERQGDKETRRQREERESERKIEREAQSLNHHGFSLPCMHHDNSPLLQVFYL